MKMIQCKKSRLMCLIFDGNFLEFLAFTGKSIYNNPCVCLFVCPAVCVTLPFWEDNPMDQVMSHYISIYNNPCVCLSVWLSVSHSPFGKIILWTRLCHIIYLYIIIRVSVCLSVRLSVSHSPFGKIILWTRLCHIIYLY